jgi:hypothetical protein
VMSDEFFGRASLADLCIGFVKSWLGSSPYAICYFISADALVTLDSRTAYGARLVSISAMQPTPCHLSTVICFLKIPYL